MPMMSWIKATISFIHAKRHPDEVAREVETELRFHIEMRTRTNIEKGMTPDDAQRTALQSFGDFDRVKNSCCEIRRSLPFESAPLKMVLHIAIAVLAGWAALWAVNMPHDNLTGVLRQLIPIGVLTFLFFVVRRAKSRRRFAGEYAGGVFAAQREMSNVNKIFTPNISEVPAENIVAHDEHGRTPIERVFKS
jgi:hypothetical protein